MRTTYVTQPYPLHRIVVRGEECCKLLWVPTGEKQEESNQIGTPTSHYTVFKMFQEAALKIYVDTIN